MSTYEIRYMVGNEWLTTTVEGDLLEEGERFTDIIKNERLVFTIPNDRIVFIEVTLDPEPETVANPTEGENSLPELD